MTQIIESCLQEVVRNVFRTMAQLEVVQVPIEESIGRASGFNLNGISGNIGFGGKISGCLFFSTSKPLAEKLAQIILGGMCEVGQSEVCDVVGELTNMVAGGVKSELSDRGHHVLTSIPNVIRGHAIHGSARHVDFILKRRFSIASLKEFVDVIVLGKLEK